MTRYNTQGQVPSEGTSLFTTEEEATMTQEERDEIIWKIAFEMGRLVESTSQLREQLRRFNAELKAADLETPERFTALPWWKRWLTLLGIHDYR